MTPYLHLDTGVTVALAAEVTTVGRAREADLWLDGPTVSPLHAELVRRGGFLYVADLGLSDNGTFVNGRPVGRRLLTEGDVVCFGRVACLVGGTRPQDIPETVRDPLPELTPRELDVLNELCRPVWSAEAFVTSASVSTIAVRLDVTQAAVKQHLLRIYDKFEIAKGSDRRTRLANMAVTLGLGRPQEVPLVPEHWLIQAARQGGRPGSIASAAGLPQATVERLLRDAGELP